MKAIVYSTKTFEKELLAKANFKKHDITLISNPLNIETVSYAEGKDAVIVFSNDDLSTPVINKLAEFGVKYISTRSGDVENINQSTAAKYGIKIAHAPCTTESVAEYVLTLVLALSRKLIPTGSENPDLNALNSFNLKGKTIGLIGYNPTGIATARIFKSIGCHILIADESITKKPEYGQVCDLDYLLQNSDIISLHISFINATDHIINRDSLSKMKPGVMLINTSRGGLLHMPDVLEALKSGQLGYLGIDSSGNEALFLTEEKKDSSVRNPVLKQLINLPNVIITTNQACFTKESIEEIAFQTIKNLDNWQAGKCVGQACACSNGCAVKL